MAGGWWWSPSLPCSCWQPLDWRWPSSSHVSHCWILIAVPICACLQTENIKNRDFNNTLLRSVPLSCFHPVSLFSFSDLEIKGQAVEDQLLPTSPPDLLSAGEGASHISPTISANRSSQLDSTATPLPTRIPPSETRKRFKPNGNVYCSLIYKTCKLNLISILTQ